MLVNDNHAGTNSDDDDDRDGCDVAVKVKPNRRSVDNSITDDYDNDHDEDNCASALAQSRHHFTNSMFFFLFVFQA